MSARGDTLIGGAAAVQRVGASVCCAVERFVAVGETIADDNPDVRHSMVLACKEARAAGNYLNLLPIWLEAGGFERSNHPRNPEFLNYTLTWSSAVYPGTDGFGSCKANGKESKKPRKTD